VVWRCLVSPDRIHRSDPPPPPAQSLAGLREARAGGGRWAIILFRGGHFAAAVVDLAVPKVPTAGSSQPNKQQQQQRELFTIAAHKSFHRYVVRAKAGGKQSTQDGTGKFARSAGSRLRRHNEVALEKDILETLASWRDMLSSCQLVLVQAPSSNWRLLASGESPPLDASDPKVRRIPFVTRRPTFSEVGRVARILLTVYEGAPEGEGSVEASAALRGEADKDEAVDTAAAASKAAAKAAKAAGAEVAREAEAAAREKNAAKKARQKEKQKEKRRAEAAAAKDADEAEGSNSETPAPQQQLGGFLSAQAAAAKQRAQASAKAMSTAPPKASLSRPGAPAGKPRGQEDAATRRARLAAAAEARMEALKKASQDQKMW
jgi:hypothetical protein